MVVLDTIIKESISDAFSSFDDDSQVILQYLDKMSKCSEWIMQKALVRKKIVLFFSFFFFSFLVFDIRMLFFFFVLDC